VATTTRPYRRGEARQRDDEDVGALLEAFLHRLKALLERWNLDALEGLPEDALTALWLESARARRCHACGMRRTSTPKERRSSSAHGTAALAGSAKSSPKSSAKGQCDHEDRSTCQREELPTGASGFRPSA
jgi:hypothetical protein